MHCRIKFILFTLILLAATMLGIGVREAHALPDDIKIAEGENPYFYAKPYISLSADDSTIETSTNGTQYTATARMLGLIPIKEIEVSVTQREQVELYGDPIGVKMHVSGVIIAGVTDVMTDDGSVNPGKLAGLREGDVVSQVDGKDIASALELIDAVEQSDGKTLMLTVIRSDEITHEISLTPVFSSVDNCYRAGIWVRDSTAGIGILTFVEPKSKLFGGLGHAICDSESGAIMPISDGEITDVILTGVKPGASGIPGELIGYLGKNILGELKLNSETGVYGIFTAQSKSQEIYPAAFKQEVREGRAQMLTTLPGEDFPQLYDIVIEKINYDNSTPTRNMVIRVTDERLIDVTGGIVQGMSGSPILQDGKFVAAATHVFVNDPTTGYGIFAENMLDSVAE